MRRAFSLIELSIVLVILGLLTGGILAGKSLIRSAELRAVPTEHQRYITAVHSFRDRYFGLPGDINNATAIWGKDNTNCSGDTGTATTPGTCNGNSDGIVYTSTYSKEHFRFWQHLALAGLVEGSYTGMSGSVNSYTAVAANSPASKISTALWSVYNFGNVSGSATLFNGSYVNTLFVGGPVTNDQALASIMTPEEIWNIDVKMDDGKPATGKLKVRCPGFSYCVLTNDPADMTSDYRVAYTSFSTVPFFPNAF